MRRLLAAAALGALVLTGAACSNSGTPTTTATSAAPATSAAAAGGNTKEICDSINAAGEQLQKDVAGLGVIMGSTDPAQAGEALKKIATAIGTFATGIEAKVANANDPAFKAALDETKTAMQGAATKLADPALQQNPSKAVDIISDPQLTKALDDLGKFCPGITG
jgi:hypothetical protein